MRRQCSPVFSQVGIYEVEHNGKGGPSWTGAAIDDIIVFVSKTSSDK
jgi:hypothetical protein